MSDVQTQTQPPVPPEGGVQVPPNVAGQPPVPEEPIQETVAEGADQANLEALPLNEADHVSMLMYLHGFLKHQQARFAAGLHPDLDSLNHVESTLRDHLEKV
jgi:hypothetical protein